MPRNYYPKLSLSTGDMVIMDGMAYKIISRQSPDTFDVEYLETGEISVRHIDWFSDRAATSDYIMVLRE